MAKKKKKTLPTSMKIPDDPGAPSPVERGIPRIQTRRMRGAANGFMFRDVWSIWDLMPDGTYVERHVQPEGWPRHVTYHVDTSDAEAMSEVLTIEDPLAPGETFDITAAHGAAAQVAHSLRELQEQINAESEPAD